MVAVLFISFVVCLALGMPVAFSLGVSSLLYFIGEDMSLYMFAQRFFAGLNSFTLLCIPGFVFAGSLMNQGGITERLIGFCNKIVGHITGGLAIANVAASMLFAGISGTALADTVSVGGVLIPAMKKDGYDADFSCAVTAASSCIGPIIPPSVPMIMAATMTGLSVSKMFVAGMVPGILMGLGMIYVSWIISKKRHYPKAERMATFMEIIHSAKESFFAILMTLIILSGIVFGLVNPDRGFHHRRGLRYPGRFLYLQGADLPAPDGVHEIHRYLQCGHHGSGRYGKRIRLHSDQGADPADDRGRHALHHHQQVHHSDSH